MAWTLKARIDRLREEVGWNANETEFVEFLHQALPNLEGHYKDAFDQYYFSGDTFQNEMIKYKYRKVAEQAIKFHLRMVQQ